jgi:hypothetical protein
MKDFIPYEQALALKELGFDEPCFGYYNTTWSKQNELLFPQYAGELENWNEMTHLCSSPLYSQAFRFFREKYGLYYLIKVFKDDDGELIFDYAILEDSPETESYDDEPYTTYEEAENACLIKLIEIVKKK